jgi:hypothetical protein
MKKVLHFLITLAVLAGLGEVLWIGIHKQGEKSADAKEKTAEPAEEAKPEEYAVMLEKKKARALGLEKEQPEKTTLQARRRAFGAVLDPLPLLTLDGELATAEAALAASKAENERTQALAATNDTSKKAVDTAAAQFLADKIKVESLIRSAQLQWGSVFTADAPKRRALMDELVKGTVALVRVDVLPGDTFPSLPKKARLLVLGREDQALQAAEIIPAASVDVKTQAQGFVLRVNNTAFALRPGMALTAWLDLPGASRAGYAVPRSAVLRHDGRTWVYAQEEEEKYVRKPVTLDSPLEGAQGWFVAEGGGLTGDDVIVVTGAASLLSEELKAQGGGEAD